MQPCKWQFEWYSGGSAWLGTTDSEARGVEGWRWWQTGPVVVVVVAAILCSIHWGEKTWPYFGCSGWAVYMEVIHVGTGLHPDL